jgi:hypothetical protein
VQAPTSNQNHQQQSGATGEAARQAKHNYNIKHVQLRTHNSQPVKPAADQHNL